MVQCPRDAVEGKRIKDQPSLELRKFSPSLTAKVKLMQRKPTLEGTFKNLFVPPQGSVC